MGKCQQQDKSLSCHRFCFSLTQAISGHKSVQSQRKGTSSSASASPRSKRNSVYSAAPGSVRGTGLTAFNALAKPGSYLRRIGDLQGLLCAATVEKHRNRRFDPTSLL